MRKLQSRIRAVFDKPLRGYGFQKVAMDSVSWGGSRIYRKGPLYVRVGVNMHPHDYPFYCDVELGEGSHEWPDWDWNHIALFMLVVDIAPERDGKGVYYIETEDEIDEALGRACCDLLDCGSGFLNGDLSRFLELRASMNSGRRPYRAYSPDGVADASACAFIEESRRLLEKYSKPIAYGLDEADVAESRQSGLPDQADSA